MSESETKPIKTSKIYKSIGRKIQTAKFENLEIHVASEEEITWSNPEERLKKSEAHTRLLLKEFSIAMQKAMQEMGVEAHTASVNTQKPGYDGLE